jgi:hypothetical protein
MPDLIDRTIIDYDIVRATNSAQLAIEVKAKIVLNWKPIGRAFNWDTLWAQTMVKVKTEKTGT